MLQILTEPKNALSKQYAKLFEMDGVKLELDREALLEVARISIARNTGGLHDTVEMLDVAHSRGNGFIFDTYDANGLFWAMDQAMAFWSLPADVREAEVSRIMRESHHVAEKSTTATALFFASSSNWSALIFFTIFISFFSLIFFSDPDNSQH